MTLETEDKSSLPQWFAMKPIPFFTCRVAEVPRGFQFRPKNTSQPRRELPSDIREARLPYLEKLLVLHPWRQATVGNALVRPRTNSKDEMHAYLRAG